MKMGKVVSDTAIGFVLNTSSEHINFEQEHLIPANVSGLAPKKNPKFLEVWRSSILKD